MRAERFELEGVTYYAESRRCGKPNCQCQKGDLHGPYWYRRTQLTGKVEYVGKDLPAEVLSTRQLLAWQTSEIEKARRLLIAQAEALGRLLRRQALTDEDRRHIAGLGFGLYLVSPGQLASAQDAVVDPSGELMADLPTF